MKQLAFLSSFLLSTLGTPLAACAADFALGGGVAGGAAQVQGDLEIDRAVGLQMGVGEVIGGDSLALSLGGRVYFLRDTVTPYVGVLFSHWEGRRQSHHGIWYEQQDDVRHFGPSIGVRERERGARGIGAFIELEMLAHVDDYDDEDDFHPALGAGIQWWF